MKQFILFTTTEDNWELCQGIHLIEAKNKAQVKKIAKQFPGIGKISAIFTTDELLRKSKVRRTESGKMHTLTNPIVE